MVDGREECVSVGWKIDAGGGRLQFENGANEGWILMRESVVLLARPCARFDVVNTRDVAMPTSFPSLQCSSISKSYLSNGTRGRNT